jgi:cytochrome c oxidase assembly protein subunit 11
MLNSANAAAGPPAQPSHRRLVIRLLALVGLAFAFGFALVPLYDAFCEATGLNGKTRGQQSLTLGGLSGGPGDASAATASPPSRIDTTRTVSIEFMGTVMPGLPWEMQPVTKRMDLHPGELHQAVYRVRNVSDKAIVGQAVPSVSPGLAARHFEKLDCFCFAQQTLAPGETKELPVTFIVNPDIDKDIRTITLAYAFFNISDAQTAAEDADVR